MAALFNSRLLNYYYRILMRSRGRPLAQVNRDVLQNIPLCLPDEKTAREVEWPATRLENSRDPKTAGRLDEGIYKLYGLLHDQVKELERTPWP